MADTGGDGLIHFGNPEGANFVCVSSVGGVSGYELPGVGRKIVRMNESFPSSPNSSVDRDGTSSLNRSLRNRPVGAGTGAGGGGAAAAVPITRTGKVEQFRAVPSRRPAALRPAGVQSDRGESCLIVLPNFSSRSQRSSVAPRTQRAPRNGRRLFPWRLWRSWREPFHGRNEAVELATDGHG